VFLHGTAARGVESPLTRIGQIGALLRHRSARNTTEGSARNIHAHYDLGNAFYALFLDPDTMAYSCGIHAPGSSETDAQRAKLITTQSRRSMISLSGLPSRHRSRVG
jgi:cyclopropane-fatty-acyl-phospholipid synthase